MREVPDFEKDPSRKQRIEHGMYKASALHSRELIDPSRIPSQPEALNLLVPRGMLRSEEYRDCYTRVYWDDYRDPLSAPP